MTEKRVHTPEFRVSYPNVFKPRKNEMNGREEFTVVALFKKGEDLTLLKQEVERAIVKKWGHDKTKWPRSLKLPFKDQGERAKEVDGKTILPAGYESGAIYCNLKSRQRPGIVDGNLTPILEETAFYPGCWAIASVMASAFDQSGNRGVTLYFSNLQKTRNDDPLSGRMKAEDEFAPIATASGEALTATDLFA